MTLKTPFAAIGPTGLRSRGFTSIEMLAVTLLIGVTTSLAIANWKASQNLLLADAFTDEVFSRIQAARFEAIKRNRNVVVFFDADNGIIRSIVKAPNNRGCDFDSGDIPLSFVSLPADTEFANGGLELQGSFIRQGGIAWKPNGLSGRCSNFNAQGANTLQIRVDDSLEGAANFDIAISTAGRVIVRRV